MRGGEGWDSKPLVQRPHPTRWRPRLPLSSPPTFQGEASYFPGTAHLCQSAGLVDKLKVWLASALFLLDLSLSGEHLSWWPGSPGSSAPAPAALPCEHQPLRSPAMGPFTLATVLLPF